MYVKDVVVNNQVGLHARPATFFTQKANEFKSTILVEREDRSVNAKEPFGTVVFRRLCKDMEITIIGDGVDEVEAVNTLCQLD